MNFFRKIKLFVVDKFFNVKWKCNGCNKENFDGGYFCSECEKSLPYIGENYCLHCGRKLKAKSNYCSTCKEHIISVDKMRSAFEYAKPISTLIQDFKYENERYLCELFTHYLEKSYREYNLVADVVTFVPMTEKARRKRGYNQSQRLAEGLAEKIKLPIYYGVSKVKETEHQAKLDRKHRVVNLNNAFRLNGKKQIKDKIVMIIDDVSTTGSTIEALSEKIKRAGAKEVIALTVASVSPKEGY